MLVAPPWGATVGAAMAVPARRGVDGHPLPLACLPLQHSRHYPDLKAPPHEAVTKGLPSPLQRGVLLVGLVGTSGRSRVPPGVRRLGLIDAVPGAPRKLLP